MLLSLLQLVCSSACVRLFIYSDEERLGALQQEEVAHGRVVRHTRDREQLVEEFREQRLAKI